MTEWLNEVKSTRSKVSIQSRVVLFSSFLFITLWEHNPLFPFYPVRCILSVVDLSSSASRRPPLLSLFLSHSTKHTFLPSDMRHHVTWYPLILIQSFWLSCLCAIRNNVVKYRSRVLLWHANNWQIPWDRENTTDKRTESLPSRLPFHVLYTHIDDAKGKREVTGWGTVQAQSILLSLTLFRFRFTWQFVICSSTSFPQTSFAN